MASIEEGPKDQELITNGEGQNVDRMVAWVAGGLGLPVPDEYISPTAVEPVTTADIIDAEGQE